MSGVVVLIVNRVLPADPTAAVGAVLALTAHDRTRSRHRFMAEDGTPVLLNLPRGTVLRGNTWLSNDQNQHVRVVAKPEPVVVVTAESPLALLRAAYHLGNRHVALEITPDCLKLEPDPVLEASAEPVGSTHPSTPPPLPFEPEAGAYRQSDPHTHSHAHNYGA
ncbi:MAG: urease accessory protein UreE [Leptolyngbyaceae cyanobacterium SM2_5_2]|nr:urease accessory protein UreE [Leptolyngbyaceae cyanobacterium SM2_5_2]